MSVILITHHDENIYRIRKKQALLHKKSPRYISRFRSLAVSDYEKSRCRDHAHMGIAHYPPPNPKQFLRKRSIKPVAKKCPDRLGTLIVPEEPKKDMTCVPTVKECLENERKRLAARPPVKNFVVENIRKNVKSKPKEPAKRIVIDRVGDKKDLSAGLEPEFIKSKDFGKIPLYLKQLLKKRERFLQSQKDKFEVEQPKCTYITREEREELLNGLKQNWEELQKQYQGLPILTDTIPKINRKAKLEADLKQLEKDIVLVERHPYIYVYKDEDLN